MKRRWLTLLCALVAGTQMGAGVMAYDNPVPGKTTPETVSEEDTDNGDIWYSVETEVVDVSEYGFYPMTSHADANGCIYNLDYGSDYGEITIKAVDVNSKAVCGFINLDESPVADDFGSLYEEYSFYVIDGVCYLEADEYVYNNQTGYASEVISRSYPIDCDSMSLDEGIELRDGRDTIANVFYINGYTCFYTTSYDIYGDPFESKLIFYSDIDTSITVDLEELTGDSVAYVGYVASLDDGRIAVLFGTEDYDWGTVCFSLDSMELSDCPDYIHSSVDFYNVDGKLYLLDESGLYVIEDEKPVPVYKTGYTVGGTVNLYNSHVLSVSDSEIKLVTTTFEGVNYTANLGITTLTRCACPYADRQRVVVGGVEAEDILLEQMQYFNENNDDYYAVYEIISDNGVNPIILSDAVDARIEEITENLQLESDYADAEYMDELIRECAFNMELKGYISGPQAPDVIATDGYWGQLDVPGIMRSSSSIYEQLDDEEYFGNVFDAAQIAGDGFVPVFFYINGIIDLSQDGVMNPEGTPVSYPEYIRLVNHSWDGSDPISSFCTINQYFEELMSCQYDLFIDRESGEITMTDDSRYNQMMTYLCRNVDSEPSWDMNDVQYRNMYCVYDYYYMGMEDGEYSFYALPSADRRNIAAEPMLCLGITAASDNIDGAQALILSTLSEESQTFCGANGWGIPVNREALGRLTDECIAYVTEIYDDAEDKDFTEDDSYLENLIENIDNIYVTDCELRLAAYAPVTNLVNGVYNGQDYSPRTAGDIILNNMEYFIQEDY